MSLEMEGNRQHRLPASQCSILCITKAFLYVLISLFILYLPLGDPGVRCANKDPTRRVSTAEDRACEVYTSIVNTSCVLCKVLEALLSAAKDALYQAKLQFYVLLNKVDKNDLCGVVCCIDAVEECSSAGDEQAETDRKTCRCTKKYCKKEATRFLTQS